MMKSIVDYPSDDGITGKDLDLLETFLLFESGLEHPMELETLDGFLTAIIVGPDILMPSEWLPLVWDTSENGGSPQFQSTKQASRIIGIIMQLMNVIVYQLAEEPDEYEPLPDMIDYEDDVARRRATRLWCIGFIMGITMRERSWEPLFRDKSEASSTTVISIAGGMFRDELQIDEEKEYEFWSSVPDAVLSIREFWIPYHEREIDRLRSRTSGVPGRNEPCPCGSGKKYKQCCGKG
ncbi:MAG: UPF0149 family protein [Chlorobiaceae bacterium]|nr:UPF0149 family protein [Chlorobiaceae bacterium]